MRIVHETKALSAYAMMAYSVATQFVVHRFRLSYEAENC